MKAKATGKPGNRSTVGGPTHQDGAPGDDSTAKLAATRELAAAMLYNANKALDRHFERKSNRLDQCNPVNVTRSM